MEKTRLKQRFPRITQETLTVTIKIAVILFTTVIVFFQDLAIIFNDALQGETTSYMLAVPFLLAYLIYRKRKMIKAAIPLPSSKLFKKVPINEITGGLLFLTSFLLYWYGSYTFTPLEYHTLALPIYASACILILFNTQTLRHLLFPIAFLFLLIPPPEQFIYNLGSLLSTISSELAYHLLKMFGFHVGLTAEYGTPVISMIKQDGTAISFALDIACSGIYSQAGFFIFALFIAYIIRDKTWKKAAVFLLGFPLIYLLNVLRITTIGIIGYYYGENLALNAFHLFGGWVLIFLGALILLAASETLFKMQILTRGNQTDQCPECNLISATDNNFCFACGRIQKILFNKVHKGDIAKTAVIILSVILILSIQTPVFALKKGPAEIIVQTATGEQVSTEILPQLPEYTLRFMYRDETFEKISRQDASLAYAYSPYNETKEVIWVILEIGSANSMLHSWEVCLITWPLSHGYQVKVNQIELSDVQLLENPPIIGRYFIFQYKESNLTQAVLYWYETSVFEVNSTSQQKQIKISIIAYPDTLDDLPEVKNQLLTVATEIASYWQPIKTWSQIALLISQNGDKLITATMALLGVILISYNLEKRKERKRNTVAYQKLSKADKQIINATHETGKNMLPTLNNISKTYNKIARQTIDKEKLMQKLTGAEKIGIIKKDIGNRLDEPVQTWKPNIHHKQAFRTPTIT
jgi:exosortase/archaeosortase family protein